MTSLEDESGLFAIDLDIDTPPSSPKLPRDHQSEEAFLEVKNTWRPKVEVGDVICPAFHLSTLSGHQFPSHIVCTRFEVD